MADLFIVLIPDKGDFETDAHQQIVKNLSEQLGMVVGANVGWVVAESVEKLKGHFDEAFLIKE